MQLRTLHEYWDPVGGMPYDLNKKKRKKRQMSFLKEPKDRDRFLKWMSGK